MAANSVISGIDRALAVDPGQVLFAVAFFGGIALLVALFGRDPDRPRR